MQAQIQTKLSPRQINGSRRAFNMSERSREISHQNKQLFKRIQELDLKQHYSKPEESIADLITLRKHSAKSKLLAQVEVENRRMLARLQDVSASYDTAQMLRQSKHQAKILQDKSLHPLSVTGKSQTSRVSLAQSLRQSRLGIKQFNTRANCTSDDYADAYWTSPA